MDQHNTSRFYITCRH